MSANRLRVMQSFGAPRPTTNPYIVQLDRALGAQPGIDHLRFSWREALTTRLDVLHLHWPETLLRGDRAWKRLGKRTLLRLLLVKSRLTGTAIVRTVHNIGTHEESAPAERRLLDRIEERADHRILLAPDTPVPWRSGSSVIPHGHYIDWFAEVPRVDADRDVLGFVGLVRRYKGVETLIDAFAETVGTAPRLRLRISGQPGSEDLAREIRARAARDARIDLDLRYLSEPDFAQAIMRSQGIVLPYRHMLNSGAALAALSLARPVLVPRTSVNEALAQEVGAGWVRLFDGDLDAADLLGFWAAATAVPDVPPDLSGRDWTRAGADHEAAYRAAVGARRGTRGLR